MFLCFFCAQELELLEDAWRGEVQDLLTQITQLQAENKRLMVSLPLRETPVTEDSPHRQEGTESPAFTVVGLQSWEPERRDELLAASRQC